MVEARTVGRDGRLCRVADSTPDGYAPLVGVKARVLDGRLVLDEEASLPEGTVVELELDDGGDSMSEDQRRALREAIATSLREAAEGKGVPAEQVLASLRARRGG